ncbi:MAG: hypothetical protein QOK16_835 [Solirubrobacteraceae bacterium]|nr:hypothetical protein [Solirubrobacteraceae bacterium]
MPAQVAMKALQVRDDDLLLSDELPAGDLVGRGERLQLRHEVRGPLSQRRHGIGERLEIVGQLSRVGSVAAQLARDSSQRVPNREQPAGLQLAELLSKSIELAEEALHSLAGWGDVVDEAFAPPLGSGTHGARIGARDERAVVDQPIEAAVEDVLLQLGPELRREAPVDLQRRDLPPDVAHLVEVEDAHDPSIALGVLPDGIGDLTALGKTGRHRRAGIGRARERDAGSQPGGAL